MKTGIKHLRKRQTFFSNLKNVSGHSPYPIISLKLQILDVKYVNTTVITMFNYVNYIIREKKKMLQNLTM